MADELPAEYEAIVVGTGMTESILAAALARIGYSVLHIDRNDHYSDEWASFHFQGLQDWIKNVQDGPTPLKSPSDQEVAALLQDAESTIPLHPASPDVRNLVLRVYVKEKLEKAPQGEKVNAEEKPSVIQAETEKNTGDQTKESVAQPESKDTITDTESADNSEDNAAKENVVSDQSSETKDCGNSQPADLHDAQEETPASAQAAVPEPEAKCESWTLEKMNKLWRKYNLDLSPKVLFCNGDMVKLLISSDVAKYCEFKTVTRVLTEINNKLEQVPCSRADVFGSKQVTMLEKRMLMKLLQFCMEYEKHPEQYQDYADKPFTTFLQSQKLTPNVRHYVHQAIAMADKNTTTIEGLQHTQKFLHSLGRYGNTAFLWPLYGIGELPQCFCRMCAVFGGVYYLQKAPTCLLTDNEKKYKGIIDTDGLRLKSKWLIMNAAYASNNDLSTGVKTRLVSRAILLTDRSLLQSDQEHISMLRLPAGEGISQPVILFELSHVSQACPKGMYVVHLTSVSTGTAEEDLSGITKKMFREYSEDNEDSDDRPQILWALYFQQVDVTEVSSGAQVPENVFLTSGPGSGIDCDHCVKEAKALFEKICPGEEFLPRAPNPEDIIYYDENNEQGTPAEPGFGSTNEEADSAKSSNQHEGAADDSSSEKPSQENTDSTDNTNCEPAPQEPDSNKCDDVKTGETDDKTVSNKAD